MNKSIFVGPISFNRGINTVNTSHGPEKVLHFDIPVAGDRNNGEDTLYAEVTAWGKMAERLDGRAAGQQIYAEYTVDGYRQFTDKNGNVRMKLRATLTNLLLQGGAPAAVATPAPQAKVEPNYNAVVRPDGYVDLSDVPDIDLPF